MTIGQLQAQAIALGVSFEKWSLLHGMGVPSSHAKKLAEYSYTLLQQAESTVTGTELVLAVGLGDHGFGVYLGLRKYLGHGQAIDIVSDRRGSEYLNGLESDVPLEEMERASENGISVSDLVEVYGSDITLDQLIEVKNLNAWPMTYIEVRRAGYSHSELVQLLGFRADGGTRNRSVDDLSLYRLLRDNGTSHAQIIEVMRSEITNAPHRYVEMRIEERRLPGEHHKVPQCTEVGHQLAMRALEFGEEYRNYANALGKFTHEQLVQAVRAGLEVRKYVAFRRNNCRITHDEVVQYAQLNTLSDRLSGINDYLRLLDDGVTFDEVMEVYLTGGSVANYLDLHGAPLDCTHQQIVEVAHLRDKLGFYDYSQLRKQGISHDDIVSGVTDLTLPVER